MLLLPLRGFHYWSRHYCFFIEGFYCPQWRALLLPMEGAFVAASEGRYCCSQWKALLLPVKGAIIFASKGRYYCHQWRALLLQPMKSIIGVNKGKLLTEEQFRAYSRHDKPSKPGKWKSCIFGTRKRGIHIPLPYRQEKGNRVPASLQLGHAHVSRAVTIIYVRMIWG